VGFAKIMGVDFGNVTGQESEVENTWAMTR